MQWEGVMSVDAMAFLTVVAVLFVAGFASGPAIARKFGLFAIIRTNITGTRVSDRIRTA
jgi:hypothetical protein